MAIFESLVFFANKVKRKCVFEGFERKRSLFRPTKHQLKKTTKINIFLKGLIHGLCQKMEIF